eukprot:Gregarina_sp_Poly_1__1715@NODE_1442_length_4145_cov_149_698627_g878_i1_p2_GENE_NODE_1442_length_4145_cov_149_698627_g878_i1NODE_1442_length_4145_cov_149_698627_g878_i1_p2_ORF_typecomplete_len292_score41_67RRM_1/PF00076_22/3e08RRM_1/PF00076_22/0_048RRM_1/PF00076_22/0_00083RRM_occluded/PF16842_5/0_74RRM_occluded/PF16842_5/1_5e03RRM_occluded/PF16842_5/1_5RRM_5/PF13893_6/2_1RRM_5/PF13893_6/7_2RRM_2/PF04059_12/1_6RRM_2/PF04059_12/26RRM_7/PF16367_5/2_4RRM_7/PF16367_5/29Nup35_RRM_2/PF14605_6/59Nup35_RR
MNSQGTTVQMLFHNLTQTAQRTETAGAKKMKEGFTTWDLEDSNENPSAPSSTLLLNGIDDSISDDEVRGLFAHHQANILGVQSMKDSETNKSIGYAYISFESSASALDALELLGGDKSVVLLSNGARGVVTFSKCSPPLDLRQFNLYVGNLGEIATEEAVEDWLINLWDTVDAPDVEKKLAVFLPANPITKIRFGFGFVRVPDENFAAQLVDVYERKKIDNDEEFISLIGNWPIFKLLRQKIDDPHLSPTTVCALGLPESISEREIRKYFEAVGEVTSVKITVTKVKPIRE